jgi:uncharacterized protein YndB with AHSA1/START domain
MAARVIKLVLLGVVAAVGALLIYAATRPDSFRVERSVIVNAPPDRVFAQIEDFRKWAVWSPWEKLDPALRRTHSGAAAGKGAIYEWAGNDKVGSGRMEIIEAVPGVKLGIRLDFLQPFEAHNTAEFSLQSRGDATRVTWAMFGPNPYMAKLVQVFMSMDAMVGRDFETGLANLKAVAESQDAR